MTFQHVARPLLRDHMYHYKMKVDRCQLPVTAGLDSLWRDHILPLHYAKKDTRYYEWLLRH